MFEKSFSIILIRHLGKVMTKAILNRFKPQAKEKNCSRTGLDQNGKKHCRNDLQPHNRVWNVFAIKTKSVLCLHIFQETFGSILHSPRWSTRWKHTINANLVRPLSSSMTKEVRMTTSAVQMNNNNGDWFRTTVGFRQGCLLSPIVFNNFFEKNYEWCDERMWCKG